MSESRILIVEDEFIVAAGLNADLNAMGYQVVGLESSGKQALESVGNISPDIVLMDIKLKGNMDGVDTALRLKREHGIPTIFLTAYSEKHVLDRAKLSEPLSYLVKPYSKDQLHAAIEIALYKTMMDKQLRKSQEELRLFKALAEASKEAIAISKPDGRLIYVNPAHEELFGRSFEEAKASNYRDYYPAESLEVLNREVAPALAAGESWEGELDAFGTGGRRFPLWERADAIRDTDGQISYTFGLMHDVSEKRRLEERRLEIEKQHFQTQKLETIGTLAGGIAHDFNNLMGIVIGSLELVLLQINAATPLRHPIDQAFQAAQKASGLTRQLLAYAGKGQYLPRKFNLNELVMKKLSFFESSVSKSVRLNLRFEEAAVFVKADPRSVEQVIVNLIVNASESYGDKPGKILLSTGRIQCDEKCLQYSRIEEKQSAGEYIFLEVSDEGCGMDEKTNRHLFDPFFTTKFAGRGLGMASVMGIVRGHKGAIFVDSAPGKGTIIRVLIPGNLI